ncbi:MAG: PTS system fructose-specific EIIABC component [Chlamydiia bacterium]|nr:PTS system fructose-specific EIIABC component [Chlamydiia bacterium]MCH9618746.1 PTS system fructose-specific EIIABC component [Chlamydiia bacterium]MCH9624514.1 PTS system fructose-specific EIIABC component [Chlamydiia bacterium]
MTVLEDYILDEKGVLFLENVSYEEAIKTLVKTMSDRVGDKCDQVIEKVLERESVVSTAIGKGIAIPHGRCPFLLDFSLAIGIVKEGGIFWNALDGEQVKIICLIAGPENNPTRYLSFLSSVTSILKEEVLRMKILNETDKKNIVNIFRSC